MSLPKKLEATSLGASSRSPVTIQLVTAGLTSVLSFGLAGNPATRPFAALGALPMLASLTYLYVASRPKIVTLEIDGRSLRLLGYRKEPFRVEATRCELRPWVLATLGTHLGDALVITDESEQPPRVYSFVVSDGRKAPRTQSRVEQADFLLERDAFETLSEALDVIAVSRRESRIEPSTFLLVPHRGMKAAYSGMLPWFGTMLGVGLLGSLGEPLLRSRLGTIVLFSLILLAIAAGLYFTFLRARRLPKELKLHCRSDAVTLEDGPKTVFSVRRAELAVEHETYIFRSKYGSYPFPVVVLRGPSNSIRVGVWDQREDFQTPGAKSGPAPDFLIGAPDYPHFLSKIRKPR